MSDDVAALPRPAARGLTLVELLVVLAITAVLALIATPSFSRFTQGAAVSQGQAGLRASLELARSEAIARATRAGVCRSTNANTAAPVCDDAAAGGIAAQDWSSGWIVYAKAAGNAGAVFEAGDVLVRRQPTLAGVAGRGRVALWAPDVGPVVFDWNGLRRSGPQGSFLVDWGPTTTTRPAAARSARATCVLFGPTGRIDVSNPVAGACP